MFWKTTRKRSSVSPSTMSRSPSMKASGAASIGSKAMARSARADLMTIWTGSPVPSPNVWVAPLGPVMLRFPVRTRPATTRCNSMFTAITPFQVERLITLPNLSRFGKFPLAQKPTQTSGQLTDAAGKDWTESAKRFRLDRAQGIGSKSVKRCRIDPMLEQRQKSPGLARASSLELRWDQASSPAASSAFGSKKASGRAFSLMSSP